MVLYQIAMLQFLWLICANQEVERASESKHWIKFPLISLRWDKNSSILFGFLQKKTDAEKQVGSLLSTSVIQDNRWKSH